MAETSFHELCSDIVYGPGPSRRYGTTLGVNLLPPDRKSCRYSCVYCQLGHSRGLARPEEHPSPEVVAEALTMRRGAAVDAIVLCGNGEPTLHPRFPEVVTALRRARDACFPGRPIVCLTSGSELGRHDVVEALRLLDEVSVKLDAGRCDTLRRVALAEGPVCVDWLTWRIRALADAVIQTCFFDGPVTNATDEEIDSWIAAVARTEARRVDVFTIDRAPPTARLAPVTTARLREIAARLQAALPIAVRVAA